jgi:hypothetical protein
MGSGAMKRLSFLVLTALLVVPWVAPIGSGAPQAPYRVSAATQPLVRKSAESITAAQLRDYLTFVASDEMEGRLAPSRGLDTTAKFIATLLSRWDVKPAGDDRSFFQRIVLRRDTIVPDSTTLALGDVAFSYGRDFLVDRTSATVSGPLVFASDGWFVKSKNRDPYRDVDPKGKVVIVTASSAIPPPGVTAVDLQAAGRGVDWIYPAEYARVRGAIGVIQILPLITQADPDAMERMRQRLESGEYYPEKLEASRPVSLPTVYATVRVVRALFAGEKVSANAVLASLQGSLPVTPFALQPDKKVSFTITTSAERTGSQNVVATVEGSDPVLKHECVALGAHYDHLGTRTVSVGDPIYNGADDDGTGTVALLAMAEALTKAPRRPKRSVLFVWHMGEEEGLWGSQYFTTFPTVPLDSIISQLNIDMIGRSRPDGDTNPRDKNLTGPSELYVIGSGMMSTELGALSKAVNQAYLKLAFNYRYDDPKDPERFFYRSDHIQYARKGIPIIFYFTGTHADYHQPGDEVSKIDFAKYEAITRTIYVTLWELAEMKTRPKVDKPLAADARVP